MIDGCACPNTVPCAGVSSRARARWYRGPSKGACPTLQKPSAGAGRGVWLTTRIWAPRRHELKSELCPFAGCLILDSSLFS